MFKTFKPPFPVPGTYRKNLPKHPEGEQKNTPSTQPYLPIKTPLEAPWPIAPVASHGVTNVPGRVLVSRQVRHWHVHCILHHQKFGHVTSNTNTLPNISGNLLGFGNTRKISPVRGPNGPGMAHQATTVNSISSNSAPKCRLLFLWKAHLGVRKFCLCFLLSLR